MADLTYLKKRAALTLNFYDDKVQAALMKIIPPKITADEIEAATEGDFAGFDCVVKNKMIRNWIDLVPENARGFVRFIYEDGDDDNILKYIRLAMAKPAWDDFCAAAIMPPSDSDLFLMRWTLWHGAVLKQPVGFDFGNFEMNAIFGALPIDIAKDKVKIERPPTISEFYREIRFAKWGLENAG